MERGWKANVEISPNCPRCGSSNTKFCYYNNYSSSQPRHFCKGCRRYWTKGGSLRNVPVGGGCRKSRRGKYSKTLTQANNAIGHSDDLMRRASSSSAMSDDGPNIDLAQVYASFLNQKPDQVQTVFLPSPEYSSLLNTDDFGHGANVAAQPGLGECFHFHEQSTGSSHFGEGNIQMCFCGLNSIQKYQELYSGSTTNFELPPLPGEEAATPHDHDMLCSNPEMKVDHVLQATQPPLFGTETHDADFLMGNHWNHFDLPRDASFSWP